MALNRLKVACCVVFVYLCLALLTSAKEFSPLTDDFAKNYDPQPWGVDNPAPMNLQDPQNTFYNEADVGKEMDEKRGTKNDRLRGLRRLSRLYGELGLDRLRPVKKTPETADDMYSLDDKRNDAGMPKRDAGPHAWYGTGMFGKRTDENRGRWRIRSPRPQPYRVGLFGKRDFETVDMNELAQIIEALRGKHTKPFVYPFLQ